jgi:hypothetical protein
MIIKLNSPQFDEFVKLCGRQECQGAKKKNAVASEGIPSTYWRSAIGIKLCEDIPV